MSDAYRAKAWAIAHEPCAEPSALARKIEALANEAHVAGVAEERARIHGNLRRYTRARVSIPQDEYEETQPSLPPPAFGDPATERQFSAPDVAPKAKAPALLPTWPPGTVVTPRDEQGPTLTVATLPARDTEDDGA